MKTEKFIKAWHAWWTAGDNRKIKRLERIMREQDKK